MRRTCCGVRVKAIASGVEGTMVRLAVDPDALVHLLRTVELIAGVGHRVRRVPSCLAHLVELRPGHPHVIGLDGQNAGCRRQKFLLLQEGRRTGIGRHADILEEHAAEQEVHLASERVEIIAEPCGLRHSSEAGVEVDRRPIDRVATECLAVISNMRELVLGQFLDARLA